MADFQALADKEYPGRFIILGTTPGDSHRDVVVYGVTGRSEPSRNRRFIWHSETRQLEVQSLKETEKNDPLRNYNAVTVAEGIAVSNGKQTDLITGQAIQHEYNNLHPVAVLHHAFKEPMYLNDINLCSYEPDAPNFTPRISGAVNEFGHAFVHISRMGNGNPVMMYAMPTPCPGVGNLLTTYEGTNVPPGVRIPPSHATPQTVDIEWSSAETIADKVYAAIGPKTGEGILEQGADFRVGVAAFIYDRERQTIDDMFIINRHA